MNIRTLTIALFISMSVVTPVLSGDEKPSGEHRSPHDDFAATSHRRFDDVEYWSGVFDDPKRDEWQKPDQLVAVLALEAGATVADLGAGTGYLLSRLSRAVGDTGRVYAVEVEATLVAHLRDRAEAERLDNVTPLLASKDNPRLPSGAVDLLIILDTYHHLDARDAYLDHVERALAPGGRVAIVDWKKKELAVGPPMDHKLARERVVEEMTAAGFTIVAEPEILENQYFLIFSLSR